MKNIAIVTIGYNRPSCMKRLLNSLLSAEYLGDSVPLYISIDNSGNDKVKDVADDFYWPNGEKCVIVQEHRLGLRKHILQCGRLLDDYDALIVLEDDIIVAPGFYVYAKSAVNYYKNDNRIAGISLYNHLWNVITYVPFQPAPSQYDAYFLQFAQSWGQIWMKNQWKHFFEWYTHNEEEFCQVEGVPTAVCNWPKSSWLKYHIRYCIEENKFFVYPYHSLSTCFSEVGEHNARKSSLVQVPLMEGIRSTYFFPNLDNANAVKYDAYFERLLPLDVIDGINVSDICVDLNCSKESYGEKKYLLSVAKKPYKVARSYGLECRPIESNIIKAIEGNSIFLYEINKESGCSHCSVSTDIFRYQHRIFGNTKVMCRIVLENLVEKLFHR